MTSTLRRVAALGAIVAVVLITAACGGSSKTPNTTTPTTSTTPTQTTGSTTTATGKSGGNVIGRTTTVLLFPSMAATLKNEGITITPVPPATVSKVVLTIPISGGHFVAAKFSGTLNHSGGVTFTHKGKKVTVTDFVINTQKKQLSGQVNGKSVPLFDLNLARVKRASEPKHTVVATNLPLAVTSDLASALNKGLSVSAFKAGQAFGVATILIALKS